MLRAGGLTDMANQLILRFAICYQRNDLKCPIVFRLANEHRRAIPFLTVSYDAWPTRQVPCLAVADRAMGNPNDFPLAQSGGPSGDGY